MRHIAYEARLAQLATHHFGPLVPAGRPPAGKEEVEQFLYTLAPTEPHECPHGAQLIGGVIVPGCHTIPPGDECLPVALKRGEQQILRQTGLLPNGVESDGRGSGVEIAQFGAARHIGDAVRCRARGQRGVEIMPKLVALPGEARRRLLMAEHRTDRDGILVTLQGPEIVPVRVHGFRRIALVADRRRQQAVEGTPRWRQIRGTAFRLTQGFHVARRGFDVWPHGRKQCAIVHVSKELRDQKDKLPVAVVFRHGIGPACVDAARYLAAGELIRGVPAQEITPNVLVPESQHGLGGQGAIANPGTPVRTRTGLQSRPLAVDQHVRQRRAQGVNQRLGGGRHTPGDAVELGTPHRSDSIALVF